MGGSQLHEDAKIKEDSHESEAIATLYQDEEESEITRK